MDKVQALLAVVNINTKTRQPPPREWRRLMRALDVLGMSPAEKRDVALSLDMLKRDNRPYNAEISLKDVPWSTGQLEEGK